MHVIKVELYTCMHLNHNINTKSYMKVTPLLTVLSNDGNYNVIQT